MSVYPVPKCHKCREPAEYVYTPTEGYPVPEGYTEVPEVVYICKKHYKIHTYVLMSMPQTCNDNCCHEYDTHETQYIQFHEVYYVRGDKL